MRVTSALDVRGIWPSLVAATLLPMILSVLTLRQARVGLRAFASGDAKKRNASLAIWIGAFYFVLLASGTVLRAKTHHHPLAGATFALAAGAGAIFLVPVSLRLGAIFARWQNENRHMAVVSVAAILLVSALGFALVLTRTFPPGATLSPVVSANLVDVLAFVIAALLASSREFEARRVLALFGPPVAVAFFVLGARYLLATPAIGATIAQRAPAFGPAVVMLGARNEAPSEPADGAAPATSR